MKTRRRTLLPGKAILLTGATGKLGAAVARSLLSAGYSLHLIVRDARSPLLPRSPRVKIFSADLTSPDSSHALEEACTGAKQVVHIAGLVDYESPARILWKANVESTHHLLSAAKRAGVKRFIHCSSTSVYRSPRTLPVSESHPFSPTNAYGKSKLEAERLVKASEIPYLILRPTAIYGPAFSGQFSSVLSPLSKGKAFLIGRGDNRVSFVHVDDLARAFVAAVKSKIVNEDFILASDEVLTQKQAFAIAARALGVNPPTRSLPLPAALALAHAHKLYSKLRRKRAKLLPEYVHTIADDRWFDVSKARKLLHWKPQVLASKGIPGMVSAWKEERAHFSG